MAERKKMTVAEILAAARAGKGGDTPGGPGPTEPQPPVSPAAETADLSTEGEAAALKAKPAPKPAAKAAAGGRPSVADILAMARAKQGAPGQAVPGQAVPGQAVPGQAVPGQAVPGEAAAAPAAKPAPKPAAAAKPAAKPAGGKTGPSVTAKPAARDTASILAAARAGSKPGPVSKADAPAGVKAALSEAGRQARADAAGPRRDGPKPEAAKTGHDAPSRTAALKTAPPMPSRPPKAAKVEEETGRRGFLSLAVGSFMALGFTSLAVTGGLFSLGLARFLFPNVLAEPPSSFKVGFKEGFPAGKVETKFVAQYGVWVVNSDVGGQQQIYALKTVCTHLGCTPNWLEAEQKFKCPCHGSGFYKDGVNFEGPAPRPLERYAIKIADDGQLEVDKSKAFQEELGQWNDPSSYVPV